jgi:hypothetical protein
VLLAPDMFFGLLARVFYPTPADILMKHMKKQKEASAGGELQFPDTAMKSPAISFGAHGSMPGKIMGQTAPNAQPINASEHWHGPGEQHDTE